MVHRHPDNAEHGHHSHGGVDPIVATTKRGLWAIKWSAIALAVTAVLQAIVFVASGSVALLADTVHNLGDVFTSVPLLVAFLFARRKPNDRFTYGFGRVEDLAGVAIVLVIVASAVLIAYESVQRLIQPRDVGLVWAVALAGVVGFAGNEVAALIRTRVGREIKSAALIADGQHARTDGLTSLAVVVSAVAVWLGFPAADPVVGLVIAGLILLIAVDSAKMVSMRLLDGVDPGIVKEIIHTASHVKGVERVADVRARWSGHRLYVEVHAGAEPDATLADSHSLAVEVEHALRHALPHIAGVTVYVDPASAAGSLHHRVIAHEHDGMPLHSH